MPVKKVLRWSIALCALVTCCVQTRVQAQAQLDLVSSWGGPVTDFQRVGDRGFAVAGQRLVILDMTDETNVHETSSVLLTGRAEAIAVRGDYAYVGGNFVQGKLIAVDISNPSSPVVTWREFVENNQTPVSGSVQHLCFYNNILFAHNRDNGDYPVAYNLANPAIPAAVPNGTGYLVPFIDTATSTNYFPRDFQIVGNLAYIATRRASTTLAIFNMQPDPMHPTYVGRLTNVEAATGHRVSVDGNKAVVQVSSSSLGYVVRFVDVTNPAAPVLRKAINDFGFARDVSVQGNIALVADWAGGINTRPSTPNWSRLKGLAIFDITNMTNPVLLGTYNTAHSSIREVQLVGNRAYAMCDGQGLVVLDISNPGNATVRGGYYSPGQPRQMAKVGNLMYVADQWNGFTILDVSNPDATPTVVGVYRGLGDITQQQHWMVAVRGDLAYLAAGNGGIQIVDVASPMSPQLVFHYPTNYLTDGHVDSVELDGNVLRAGQEEFELPVCTTPPSPGYYNYDISNPRMIVGMPGSHGCVGPLRRLVTKGGVTFSGYGGGGNATICLDTANNFGPISVAVQEWGGDDMEIQGEYLYVANSRSDAPGLSIADVTNPYLPVRVGFWPQPTGFSRSVAVAGNRAFVGNSGTIDVLDITNKAAPVSIAQSRFTGAGDLVAEGDLCYATYYGIAPQNPAGSFVIQRLVERRGCGTSDFDGDGDFGTDDDIEAFFACLAGSCCATCYSGGSDFDADGDFGTDFDIEAFFRVLAGNPC